MSSSLRVCFLVAAVSGCGWPATVIGVYFDRSQFAWLVASERQKNECDLVRRMTNPFRQATWHAWNALRLFYCKKKHTTLFHLHSRLLLAVARRLIAQFSRISRTFQYAKKGFQMYMVRALWRIVCGRVVFSGQKLDVFTVVQLQTIYINGRRMEWTVYNI